MSTPTDTKKNTAFKEFLAEAQELTEALGHNLMRLDLSLKKEDVDPEMINEVLETMNGGGYTYVQVKTDSGVIWAAGPQAAVKVGDKVNLGDGMLMSDFHSETLDRTFEEIYFVGGMDRKSIEKNPALEVFRKRNLEVLYLSDPVDEFVLSEV